MGLEGAAREVVAWRMIPWPDRLARVAAALNDAGVRWLVVGGLAVVAHGHARATLDADFVIDLEPRNARAALDALTSLGYQPRLPVAAADFADATRRGEWVRTKGMVVFPLFHAEAGWPLVDLFAEEPFDVGEELRRAVPFELAPGVALPVVSLARLIAMKERVGRAQDLADVAALRRIRGDAAGAPPDPGAGLPGGGAAP